MNNIDRLEEFITKVDGKDGLTAKFTGKTKKYFNIDKSIKSLRNLIKDKLSIDEIIKIISYDGGFSSISFIKYVSEKEKIEELVASTLRVGEKQFNYMAKTYKEDKLLKATFFIGSIMKEDTKKDKKYDYYTRFKETCNKNNWQCIATNNHSKIILMKTENNYYVLETSSNLNENPKIEQYSFENSKELYCFYYDFFKELKNRLK